MKIRIGSNRIYKVFFFLLGSIILLGLLLWNLFATHYFKMMRMENNRNIAVLADKVKEAYPAVKEEEWIAFLNQTEIEAGETAFFEQYGILEEDGVSRRQDKWEGRLFLLCNGILALTFGGIILLFLCFLHKRKLKIEALLAYMQKVEQGDYALEMAENTEDELSGLKNELYKITVMLKEGAELSAKQKKALADSVSDISHQLKTPLTSVMVLLDNLTENKDMDETMRTTFLAEITKQITNINWMVAALLKLSRLDAGVVEFERKEVDVDRLLLEVTEKLEILAELKNIAIQKEGNTRVKIEGDFRWLSEAVLNIVKNAIEHSPENTPVLIQVEENAVYTAISIRDFGEGMGREDKRHIFERFYRGSYAGEDSVGIGLSLAKEIVERQNGYIAVETEEGKGCIFCLKFIK